MNLKKKMQNTVLGNGQIALFYLGQVGYVVKHEDKYVLIDCYLSDYVDRHCASELVPWKRRYPAPMQASELDFIDYVFCTHAHYDHADPDTLTEIARVNSKAVFFVSNAIRETLLGYGLDESRVVGLSCDAPRALCDGITVTAIPSAHEELHQNANGDYEEVGFRFAFGHGDTAVHLYHGGDGCPYDGLEARLEGVDILIVPVNGRDYYRRYVCDIIGNFDSREAVLLAQHIGAKLLVPTHFDLYDVNCLNPAQFVDTLNATAPTQSYHIFTPGERYIYAN